jgi:hypothetical protein
MSKYRPLKEFLLNCASDRWSANFSEIERILGFKLPASAWQYNAWWSNHLGRPVASHAWLEAGFKTQDVNLQQGTVTFVRSPAMLSGVNLSMMPPPPNQVLLSMTYGCQRADEWAGQVTNSSSHISDLSLSERSPETVALVSCGKLKRDMPSAAQDLYLSPLFKKSRCYAEGKANRWYILSAEHGLVEPSAMISPYDNTLKGKRRAERMVWVRRVYDEICKRTEPNVNIVMLAGHDYSDELVQLLRQRGHLVEEPLEGLSQGRRLARLDSLNSSAAGPSIATLLNPAMDIATEFYRQIDRLYDGLGGGRRLGNCTGHLHWPKRGVYFLFEPSELRTTPSSGLRVVRVGTHAVSAGSANTFWKRLSNHRGTGRGGGNHRGSVFRRHVGRALMNRDPELHDAPSWSAAERPSGDALESERQLEAAVSVFMANLTVLWLSIDDEPSKESDRSFIERNSIALLSGAAYQAPSDTWLGRHSDQERIRRSGLWNLDFINGTVEPEFLARLEKYVTATLHDV